MHRGLLALFLCAIPSFGVTFDKDVAPLVFEHCAPCHHSGGIGPFPLMTYSDVAKHAAQIVGVTQSRTCLRGRLRMASGNSPETAV